MQNFAALTRLLTKNLLSDKNQERLVRIFYDAAKIVSRRQCRLQKLTLKMKEISSAVLLAEGLHSDMFRFDATGPLAECFGNFSEGDAVEYFEASVMGQVTDQMGRTIKIDEGGLKSLYKEKFTGKHMVASTNYEQIRGKRLPWIRYTLCNSTSTYVHEEAGTQFRRSYLYIATVSIPLKNKPAQTAYYVVVVRKAKSGDYKMITAYSMLQRNKFLRLIEPCFKEV